MNCRLEVAMPSKRGASILHLACAATLVVAGAAHCGHSEQSNPSAILGSGGSSVAGAGGEDQGGAAGSSGAAGSETGGAAGSEGTGGMSDASADVTADA